MPLGWVAAAGVVGSVATGAMQAGAAEDAANAQAQSAANAQAISQQQYQDTVNRNAPFTQSGYGALSDLDYLMGVIPQNAQGQSISPSQTSGQTPNGYDPSSGYRIGAGGQISQAPILSMTGQPTGMSRAPIPAGTSGLPGSISRTISQPFGGAANGLGTTNTAGSPPASATGPYNGPMGGSGMPIGSPGAAPQGSPAGGFGSLATPFTTANWQQLSPAYNFQLQQGQQGVRNADAAGQGAMSGSALKDLTDYNQSAANTSFNNAFNQYQTQQGNIFSRLSGIAGLGQSSANNTGQQGTTLAGQAAQSATNIGTAQAGGIVGSANAISGGINNALPWLTAGGGGNSNPSLWDTENPNNFQDFTPSDRRLKTDIERVGVADSGLPIYRFKYLHANKVHIGFMADEVEQLYPEAVSTDTNGFKMVDYGRVG